MKFVDLFISVSGFKKHKNVAYGRIGSIFYSLEFDNSRYGVNVTAFASKPGGILQDEITKYVAEEGKQYKAKLSRIDGGAITVAFVTHVKRTHAERIWAFLTAFDVYLEENGYVSTCTMCGCQEGLFCVFRNGMVKEVCENCFDSLSEASAQIKQQRKTTGSYLSGAIGAILGGIIGIIPWVLLGVLGYISALSGIVMAILSFKGYQLLKGKQSKGMLFIIIGVLVVFTYFGVIASEVAVAYDDFSYFGISAFEAVGFVTEFSFMADFSETAPLWGNIALGLLFAGAGSFGYLNKIKKQSTGEDLDVVRL